MAQSSISKLARYLPAASTTTRSIRRLGAGPLQYYASCTRSSSNNNPFNTAVTAQMCCYATTTVRRTSAVVALSPPRSLTHEGLAYAACPICRSEFHMHDMFLHLTSTHKELSVTSCRAMCDERLGLYERSIGSPLRRGAEAAAPSAQDELLQLLPTITAKGYLCNWCAYRRNPFPTRDAFLKHLIHDHPFLDLDEIEHHIGYLPSPQTSGGGPASSKAPARSHSSLHHTPTRSLVRGMEPSKPEAPVSTAHMAPRTSGISVPRSLSARNSAAPIADALTADLSPEFSDSTFPCELCTKVFATELNLLNHYEGRHPDCTAASPAENTCADVSQFMKEEAAAAGEGGPVTPICVMCDLCSNSKVFTQPSALFAHLRFKHPAEDAAFHVERLIEESKAAARLFVCPHCKRGFASETALNGHIVDKHSAASSPSAATTTTTSGGSSSSGSSHAGSLLPPVTIKNRWWCNLCEKGFSQARGLHGHMVGKHQLQTQAFPCPACKRVFSDVHSLEDHFVMQHTSVTLRDLGIETHVACNQCDRLFLTHEQLHSHAVKHHKKDPRLPARALDAAQPSLVSTEAAASSASSADVSDAFGSSPSEAPVSSGPRKVQRKKK